MLAERHPVQQRPERKSRGTGWRHKDTSGDGNVDITRVVTAAALWTCLHVLYVYANAQMAQQNLNSFVVSHLTRTLNRADVDPRWVNELYVMGTAPLSPIAENSFRSVPYLRSLVRPLSHRWAGMETKLMLQERGFGTLRNRDDNTGAVRSLGSTALMDLSLQGRRLDVKFKSPESQR